MSELMFGEDPEWPDAGEPAYKRIAREYVGRIARGELPDGAKLPGEREMAEQSDVSVITARAAIAELKRRGLVVSVQRKGVFVRRPNVVTRLAGNRYRRGERDRTYNREAVEAGATLDPPVITSQRVEASEDVARLLAIDPGDRVMQTTYLVSMDGQPRSWSTCWEPLEITAGTSIEVPDEGPMAGQGIVARFDSIGVYAKRVEESLTIRQPTTQESERLDVPPNVPVIVVEQVFRAGQDADLPIEAAVITFPSDRYQFRYDMEII